MIILNHFRILFLSFFLLASIGCAGTMQTARTNGKDNLQIGVETGVTRFTTALGPVEDLSVNLAARYGVSDRLDLGVRFGTLAYEIQSKVMLTSPSEQDIAISLAPSLTVLQFNNFSLGSRIPLLIGIAVGDSELTITPRISPTYLGGTDINNKFILAVGGSIGFAARLGDWFWILPEISVDIPVIGGVVVDKGAENDINLARIDSGIINFGVGFLFGGRPAHDENTMQAQD